MLVKDTVREVVWALLPVSVFIVVTCAVMRFPAAAIGQFLAGALMVGAGLTLFLLGVRLGLLPLGESIGNALPQRGRVWIVIVFGFLLGFAVTVAEPDVRILITQVGIVSDAVPSNLLLYSVALGVGIFTALALLRVLFNVPLPLILAVGYGIALALSAIAPPHFIPVSFDAGGVTTGPMTVPFIISLGVGFVSSMRGKTTSSDGFGLVAMASLGPIIAVLLLGVIYG